MIYKPSTINWSWSFGPLVPLVIPSAPLHLTLRSAPQYAAIRPPLSSHLPFQVRLVDASSIPTRSMMKTRISSLLAFTLAFVFAAWRLHPQLNALANIGFLLNAFNLLPIGFLDGGHIAETIRQSWRAPVIRFEGGVPMQAFAPDRARAVELFALYVGISVAVVLCLLATRPNGATL